MLTYPAPLCLGVHCVIKAVESNKATPILTVIENIDLCWMKVFIFNALHNLVPNSSGGGYHLSLLNLFLFFR